jgi:hypothetical protein
MLYDSHSCLWTGGVPYALSLQHQMKSLSLDTYHLLADTICLRFPSTPVHCCSDHTVFPNSLPLDHTAIFFEYVIVDGKRYYTSHMTGCNKSSFIHVVIPGPFLMNAYGEILEIFQFDQDFRQTGCLVWFAHIRWFKSWSGEREGVWDNL